MPIDNEFKSVSHFQQEIPACHERIFSETKLLICGAGGSGNIKDRSTSATKTIASFNGDVKKVPFSPFKHHPWIAADYGGSVYFDGNDQLTVPTDADFDMGTGAFTVEAWIYPTRSMTSGTHSIIRNDGDYNLVVSNGYLKA